MMYVNISSACLFKDTFSVTFLFPSVPCAAFLSSPFQCCPLAASLSQLSLAKGCVYNVAEVKLAAIWDL